MWVVTSDIFLKKTVQKGGIKSHFSVEKPDPHDLSQVIKVCINMINHVGCMYLDMMR